MGRIKEWIRNFVGCSWKRFYVFRLSIYRFIKRRLGVTEGEILPWWIFPIKVVLFPAEMLRFLANRTGFVVYDWATDTVIICGVHYSMTFFESVAISSLCNSNSLYRFRKTGLGVGVITVEEFRLDRSSGWVYIEGE